MIVQSPFDAHVHLRQPPILYSVLKYTAQQFAGCLAMPNTRPAINLVEQAIVYREMIAQPNFKPFATLYLRPEMKLENVDPNILAVKFYPCGLTNNSDDGCDPRDPRLMSVFARMEELGLVLCVHAESPGPYMTRELLFHPYLYQWAKAFPKLRIVIEHISDFRTIALIDEHTNLFGTITPHHLYITGNDWVGPPLNIHHYCMPVCKTEVHRDMLRSAVLGGHPKLMLGTDSAPHPLIDKQAGKPGIFNAPIALQLIAQLFDGDEPGMQFFCSDNARAIYGIELPKKTVELERRPFKVLNEYDYIVPMFAGKTLNWAIKDE